MVELQESREIANTQLRIMWTRLENVESNISRMHEERDRLCMEIKKLRRYLEAIGHE